MGACLTVWCLQRVLSKNVRKSSGESVREGSVSSDITVRLWNTNSYNSGPPLA